MKPFLFRRFGSIASTIALSVLIPSGLSVLAVEVADTDAPSESTGALLETNGVSVDSEDSQNSSEAESGDILEESFSGVNGETEDSEKSEDASSESEEKEESSLPAPVTNVFSADDNQDEGMSELEDSFDFFTGRMLPVGVPPAYSEESGASDFLGAITNALIIPTINKIVASDRKSSDMLNAIAYDPDSKTLVAGASRFYDSMGEGATYVYQKEGDTWVQKQKLIADDTPDAGVGWDTFGLDVALEGNLLAVSAPQSIPWETPEKPYAPGKVYLYEKVDGAWRYFQTIVAEDPIPDESFGRSVDIDAGRIAVGAPSAMHPATKKGRAFLFEKNEAGVFVQTQEFLASDGRNADLFGYPVQLNGALLGVGASGTDQVPNLQSKMGTGSVYVFEQTGNAWIQKQEISPTFLDYNSQFGLDFAWSGGSLIVGASGYDHRGVNGSGAVFVVQKNGDQWNAENPQIIGAPDGSTAYEPFGLRVAVDGSNLLISNKHKNQERGSVYAYSYDGTQWSYKDNLTVGGLVSKDYFGSDLVLSGADIFMSAKGDDGSAGAVYFDTLPWVNFALDIIKSDEGSGAVEADAVGIDCGGSCSASVPAGTVVALTAKPDSGSVFEKWEGDADCTDGNVTMDSAKNCIAVFQKEKEKNVSFSYDGWQSWNDDYDVSTGDFNGDGRTDIFLKKPGIGLYYVALTNTQGTGFTYTKGTWSEDYDVSTGDFNGDGKTDIFLKKPGIGLYYVALTNTQGTGFTYTKGTWSEDYDVSMGDFNGEKRTDIFLRKKKTNQWIIGLCE